MLRRRLIFTCLSSPWPRWTTVRCASAAPRPDARGSATASTRGRRYDTPPINHASPHLGRRGQGRCSGPPRRVLAARRHFFFFVSQQQLTGTKAETFWFYFMQLFVESRMSDIISVASGFLRTSHFILISVWRSEFDFTLIGIDAD